MYRNNYSCIGQVLQQGVFTGSLRSETWYNALLVVEATHGRDHLQRLLDMMRTSYLQPNQPRTKAPATGFPDAASSTRPATARTTPIVTGVVPAAVSARASGIQ